MEGGEQHHQAFGEHTRISEDCIEDINGIKNNDPAVDDVTISPSCLVDTSQTTQTWLRLAWTAAISPMKR